jgi:Ca2+-binding RTX toxin-like protein/GH24 family phage-related lysozyme (muramidase)/pantothenate kinase
MALIFTTTDYNTTLFNLLKDVEGAKQPAYIDTAGLPSIGIGFNIRDNDVLRNMVFTLFGLDWDTTTPPRLFTDLTDAQRIAEDAYITQLKTLVTTQYAANPSAATSKAFGDSLNAIMAERWSNLISQLSPADQAKTRHSFSFADKTDTGEMRPIFDSIIPSFEKNVNDWLPNIPQSREKAALVSIAYGGTRPLGGQGKLWNAINSGDRAKAWFEIRYNTNGGDHLLAKRRYLESQMFGLYSNQATMTPEQIDKEDKDVYRMYVANKPAIENYDNTNARYMQLAIGEAGAAGVGQMYVTISDALQQAANYLKAKYGQGQFFDYLHIFVGANSGSTINRASDTSGDLIIGDIGSDNLTGGTGNDVLVGGKGSDILKGGAGTDTYVFNTGDGADTIIDSDGLGKILENGVQLTAQTATFQGNNTWVDGSTQYQYDPNKNTLTITTGSDTITIDNFDHLALFKAMEDATNGYLGIHLANQVTLTAGTHPFTGVPTNQMADVPQGTLQTLTVAVAAVSNTAQTLTLQLSNTAAALWKLITGADTLSFAADGTVQITIQPGQSSVSLALVDTSGNTQPDTAQLTASLTDANGNVTTSNNLAVTFDHPVPDTSTTTPGTADYIYIGDFKPLEKTAELAVGSTIDPTWRIVNSVVGQTTTNSSTGNTVVLTYVDTYKQVDSVGNFIPDTSKADPNRKDYILGSAGNDSINAGGGDNVITATQGGNDTIVAGAGKDYIIVNTGNDLINAGDGDNSVTVGDGNNTITTGKGNDQIYAGKGNNVISGGGGQDIMITGNGNNQIFANDQTDFATALANQNADIPTSLGDLIAVGDGNNTIVGSTGNDAIFTGTGYNTIVCGPGSVSVIGGVEVSAALPGWGESGDVFSWVSGVSASNSAPTTPYYGNTFNGVPVGTGNDTIFGGTGNSFYWLSNGNNWLDAGGGNDLIFAGSGSSSIFGGKGNDTIYGGGGSNYINLESGNDQVVLQGGNNTIIGGTGTDTIFSGDRDSGWADSQKTTANNYIYGGAGNSFIFGSGGNDTLIGGTGNTYIGAGSGNEYIVGASGDDGAAIASRRVDIYGGSGNDTIYAGDGNTWVKLNASTNEKSTVYGGAGYDSINGGGGTDVIFAGDGGTADHATTVFAGSGTSTIYGGAGVDYLSGTTGNDTLVAGTGTSTLHGGSGTEVMYSSIGNVTLYAGTGSDTLYGGSGTDVLQGNSSGTTLFVAGTGNETIMGGTGNNTYEFDPGFGNVELKNTQAADTFNFGVGIDPTDLTLTASIGSDGNLALLIKDNNGGQITIDDGFDRAINSFAFANMGSLTLDELMAQAGSTSTTVAGTNGNLIFSSIGSDTLVGGAGNDTLYGWNGGNTMTAGTGDQILNSYSGNDTLTGGTGNDTLISSAGNDLLVGGVGNTTFVVNSTTDNIQAQSTGSNANTVKSSVSYSLSGLSNVQNLTLTGSANLTGSGNDLNNVITANSGNDTLMGGRGNATLIGGSGLDTFVMHYGMGSDTVIDTSSLGGVIQLAQGASLSDITAVQQGNDLLLELGSNDSMLIQGYYSNPQTEWTIKNSDGSNSFLLNNTVVSALSQQPGVLRDEGIFAAQIQATIKSYYPTTSVNGSLAYTPQADGSLYGLAIIYPAFAYDLVTTTTATTTQYFVTNGVVTSTNPFYSGTTSSDTWTPSPYYYNVGLGSSVSGQSIMINQVTTTPDNATSVIYADAAETTTSVNLGYQWFQMSWTSQIGNQTGSGNYYSATEYIYQYGYSYSQNTTGLGTLLGFQVTNNVYTTNVNLEYGTPVGTPISSPGNLTTSGSLPQAMQSLYSLYYSNYEIQTINLGSSDQTVYAGANTIVNTSTGNDSIYNAGYAYGGFGNDTMIGGGTMVAGSGNDLFENGNMMIGGTGNDTMIGGNTMKAGSGNDVLIGGNTMIAGSGLDQIFAGTGTAAIQINPTVISSDLIGGAGVPSQFLNAFYQAMGITDWQGSYQYANMYYLPGSNQWFSNPHDAFNALNKYGNGDIGYTTIQGAIAAGDAIFYAPLPVLASTLTSTGLQPSSYYSTNQVTVVNVPTSANDFQGMAPYFADGVLPQHTVSFGQGVTASDLKMTWGQTTGSISGLSTDPQLQYTTLNISWGTNNQSIQVMIPHTNDPLGSGVSGFTFADGTTLSMAQMISLAPPAPSFDPGAFLFKLGMGAQVMDGSYDRIEFPASITARNAQFFQQGNDLLVKYGTQGDSLLIQNFIRNDGSQRIAHFQFSDGSQGTYVNDGQGNANMRAYDVNGNLVGDFWQAQDGTYGNDTFNLNGSSSGTAYNADGIFSTYTNDGVGDTTTTSYDTNGNRSSDSWTKSDRSYGSDTFNANGSSSGTGYNADGSYNSYTNDGHGNITISYFDVSGNVLGSSVSISNGLGNTTTTNYDANGIVLSDSWTKADGSYGSDTYNPDGSRISITNDGLGDTMTASYDAVGVKQHDNWRKADGSYGNDTFNADGSNSGMSRNNQNESTYTNNGQGVITTIYYSYWTKTGSSISTNDGLGDTSTTNYDANGIKLNHSWAKSDGSHGSDTFNSDGSYNSSVNDGHGDVITQNFDTQSHLINDQWTHADGSSGTDNFDSVTGQAISSTITAGTIGGETLVGKTGQNTYVLSLGSGHNVIDDSAALLAAGGDVLSFGPGISSQDVSFTQQGADVLVSYSANDSVLIKNFNLWGINGPALIGSCTFADGSSIGISTGTSYDVPGSYSLTWYDAQRNKTSDLWAYNTGSHGTDTFNTDGSSVGIGYNPDGSYYTSTRDVQGNYAELGFNASGIKTYDYFWHQADGSRSEDYFNADGSSNGSTHNASGSYSSYTDDGHGNVTTTNFDASGNELGYSITTNDGRGDLTTTDYNAITGEVSGSVATAGAGYIYTYDNTKNVNGVAGETESKVTYTYADGSTYATDTVNDPNGSYQQSTVQSNGSATTTDYNAATGEVIGSVATAGAGYSYTYDNTQNVNGVSGETESKVTYTYADGSTYSTDTVYDPNGSYQQATAQSNGSATTTNYNAATGEVSGSVATAGAGYSYTYDNTKNVNGVAGEAESKVTYTYADGSTYATDTVNDPDGSYQQSTAQSNGSSTTTNYNAATGEVSGSVATAGAGYSYVYDNTKNVNGVSGETESKVTYTYADGSTYGTDTVYDPNGSYQQSTVQSNGSATTTDYNAATGEVIGSVATAGSGYSYTYDNTQNVNGVAGETESKVTYTYADGSTYGTDTVNDPNGSYQQSTVQSNGSATTTDYNAVTGEVSGSVATAGAGYSYTYDNTKNVGGVSGETESKVIYTYADASTYSVDTVYNPDGSYFQGWSKSDGTAGSVAVKANGTLAGGSWVHADGTQGVDASSNQLLMGGIAADTLAGGNGADLLIGGAGNDVITTGAGTNIIAFDKGDGQDVVNATSGQNNSLSLGGSFAYKDLALQKNGSDLILEVGPSGQAGDSITFKGWYAGNNNIVDLQVIASAMTDFNPGSIDTLRNTNVENFDFQKLVGAFDQALAANPGITAWGVTNSLLDAHLASSGTAALGGDLAFEYGMRGNLSGFSVGAAQNTLSSSQFATAPQTLNPWPTLNTGTAQIR